MKCNSCSICLNRISCIELIIFSFEGEQLLVSALLDDASVVEDDDLGCLDTLLVGGIEFTVTDIL